MNTYIRTLYSPEKASITFSFYKTNLALSFSPWMGPAKKKLTEYNPTQSLSTTISDDSAATLYHLAKNIVAGTIQDPIRCEIPCNKDAMIIFEYDPGQVYLTIEKNGSRVVFEFATQRYMQKKKGGVDVHVVQSGLIAFTKVLDAYLTAIRSDLEQNDEYHNEQQRCPSGWM